jgi:hypothetical protein
LPLFSQKLTQFAGIGGLVIFRLMIRSLGHRPLSASDPINRVRYCYYPLDHFFNLTTTSNIRFFKIKMKLDYKIGIESEDLTT